MAKNTSARPNKDLKGATKRPQKKATAPVFQGFVKTLGLSKYFTDDKDLSLKIMGVILLGSALGNSYCRNMTTLSYPVQDELTRDDEGWLNARYYKGRNDLAFVSFWIIFFIYFRALVMKSYFNPMGKRLNIRGAKLERFEEQGYILVYYIVSWSIGMYLMYNSPHWMNTDHYWIGYPHHILSGEFKAYYLIQFGFWLQQIYVVNNDMKRKDYYAMLAHHFITCFLIGGSYAFHLTRIGNAILVVMDVSDVFLAIPKMLKYQGYTAICDYLFGLFVISWAITRHYLFPIIIMSLYHGPQTFLEMKWEPENEEFLSLNIQRGFLALLYGLEAVLCFWFLMIFKVIYKMFNGAAADDNRSHDEESEEEGVKGDDVQMEKLGVSAQKQKKRA
ncbi:sphingosine N-acyltransferase lag1 [Mortierella polycephala]|uniref:Sphingosine N-acyltransferase lag1 n=1 Tax=Mortierella polycephala TaxID=41804 RepID=A0A9P6TYR0_9FUNG|nr:sphingosine N-acyltransferase lag1 [Mortierella polycephala]